MPSINEVKQQITTDTPVLLFECVLRNGSVERWASHGTFVHGTYFEARVIRHDLFELQLSADDATDGVSRLALVLANADSVLSELNSVVGFKGAQLTVYFAFADLPSMQATTERTILFRGIAGDPDEVSEDSLTLSFVNKLNLQRIPFPEVRIQRTCSWNFPATLEQRQEAAHGGAKGPYSHFFRCGYSPDIQGGSGNLDANGNTFLLCDKSRGQCEQRGMFAQDSNQRITGRFSGFEFVPSAISVRTAGDKASHLSAVLSNSAKYNDPVPLVYGTSWLKAPIIFARNDGNLTHMDVLLGMGEINAVLKVIVNDIEIPLAVAGKDMNATGWYSVYTAGARNGNFNLDFLDDAGKPLSDPYGSMAAMSVVVPNRISTGSALPTVQVLLQGVKVNIFDANLVPISQTFSNNPAWVILDIMRRCGWTLAELDIASFVRSAAYCGELITINDPNGTQKRIPRFQCNLAVTKRQSAAYIVRGIRVASSLMLRYGASGLLELFPETTIRQQQLSAPDGTNSISQLDGGWPTYEFSDDSAPFSGIVRADSGASTVRLISRSMAEISNRLSVEFQDEESEFQQDSLSIIDSSDSSLIGYEISSQSSALGLPNYNQATRVLLRQLDKSIKGNLFVEFQTSFRALKVRPGDLITLTYLKEGFQRQIFRVVRLAPSTNYHLVTITAQLHNDDWYSDDINVLSGAGRQPAAGVQSPRPLIGTKVMSNRDIADSFGLSITESVQPLTDGTASDLLTVHFSQPTKPSRVAPRVPLVSLSPEIIDGGGSLSGQTTYYYAVSAVDNQGQEGPLSFTVKATIEGLGQTYGVSLKNLSFPSKASTFNVYRGASPQLLYRIADNLDLQNTFDDNGSTAQPIGPPDPNFDHANFYYRYEVFSGGRVDASSDKTITFNDFGATLGAYTGMLVQISAGKGKGQERSIAGNDATSLTIASPWSIMPDQSSEFVICESSWRFAGVTAVTPIQFSVPYRAKTFLQITGRAANVYNQEGSPELCPTTRFCLGEEPDFGVPAAPTFTLFAPGFGQLSLSEVGFGSDQNLSSISSGTLNLYYWDETAPVSTQLAAPLTLSDSSVVILELTSTVNLDAGRFFQAGSEVLYLLSKLQGTSSSYIAVRAQLQSHPTYLPAQESVLQLQNGKLVVPFAASFFENRSSVNLIHSFNLPDVRVAAAEFFVENGFGTSQTTTLSLTENGTFGLRTLSGGQFNLQVSGYVTSQTNATPPLIVQATHAIRDIRVVLGQPSAGSNIKVEVFQDSAPLCSLIIPAGETTSGLADGTTLPVLRKDSTLTTNISTVLGNATSTVRPAKDLTVTIRM